MRCAPRSSSSSRTPLGQAQALAEAEARDGYRALGDAPGEARPGHRRPDSRRGAAIPLARPADPLPLRAQRHAGARPSCGLRAGAGCGRDASGRRAGHRPAGELRGGRAGDAPAGRAAEVAARERRAPHRARAPRRSFGLGRRLPRRRTQRRIDRQRRHHAAHRDRALRRGTGDAQRRGDRPLVRVPRHRSSPPTSTPDFLGVDIDVVAGESAPGARPLRRRRAPSDLPGRGGRRGARPAARGDPPRLRLVDAAAASRWRCARSLADPSLRLAGRGTEDSVAALDAADLAAWWRGHLAAEDALIAGRRRRRRGRRRAGAGREGVRRRCPGAARRARRCAPPPRRRRAPRRSSSATASSRRS